MTYRNGKKKFVVVVVSFYSVLQKKRNRNEYKEGWVFVSVL
jgi:hypothetical protein